MADDLDAPPDVARCPLCDARVEMHGGKMIPTHRSPANQAIVNREADLEWQHRQATPYCAVSFFTIKEARGIARDREERAKPGRYSPGHP